MLTSITKVTKSFLSKILIGIIILPFLFWGMGDVFRTGNQNVVVTIDSEKISAQSFVEYVNRLNLNEQQKENLAKTDLLDRILADYIGKKIISLEITDQGINLNSQSLKGIILNDETFKKDNKFSRTAYEKFLLESGVSAAMFEQNIAEQEKKRHLLTFLSEGINLPEFLIEKEYASENQIKTIKYLALDNLYKVYSAPDEEIKKAYESNKNLFTQEFKKINYIELLPNNLTGQKEYNESYFKKIDEIENAILDGSKMSDFVKQYNFSVKVIEEISRLKKDKSGKELIDIDKDLFAQIFNAKNVNRPKLINLNNTKFINDKIGLLELSNSNLFLENNNLFLNTNIKIDIKDSDRLYSFLQTNKKSRKNIKNILVNLDYDFLNNKVKFNNIKIDNNEVGEQFSVALESLNDNSKNNLTKSIHQ